MNNHEPSLTSWICGHEIKPLVKRSAEELLLVRSNIAPHVTYSAYSDAMFRRFEKQKTCMKWAVQSIAGRNGGSPIKTGNQAGPIFRPRFSCLRRWSNVAIGRL
jgi:hypothetical protein